MRPSVGPEERSTSTALDSRRGRRDTAEAPPWWCTQANATWAASAVALLAFAVCAVRLLQPHALLGIVEYDDGVYVGATVRLVHGIVPYRDFVFGHPPGILLLLLPLAILARFTG